MNRLLPFVVTVLLACDPKEDDTSADTTPTDPETEEVDADGDGAVSSLDCDDNDASAYPGATEVCDDIDNNCDGVVDEGYDIDGDGWTTCAGDCDDNDKSIRPEISETCDGIDNNCDGNIDEGLGEPYYTDFDGDGYGDPTTKNITCQPADDEVNNSDDCDDTNSGINPDAADICDGIDNNCDGSLDEDAPVLDGYLDLDSDGFGGEKTTGCDGTPGFTLVDGDCDDKDATSNPDAEEVCDDAADNNCDGATDEYCYTAWTGYETFEYSEGLGYGERNCDLLFDTSGTANTVTCSGCLFGFTVDYAYDSVTSSSDSVCDSWTWIDGNAAPSDHTFTYAYSPDYYGSEALLLEYYGGYYLWFYASLDTTNAELTYTYGYKDSTYGSDYYTYYQYAFVELK